MADRCRWKKDREIGRYFVPGCMGGAVYGEEGCTCSASRETLTDRIERLEGRVNELTRLLASRPVCEAVTAEDTSHG